MLFGVTSSRSSLVLIASLLSVALLRCGSSSLRCGSGTVEQAGECVVPTDAGPDGNAVPLACSTLAAIGAPVTVSTQTSATRGNAPGLVTLSGGGAGMVWLDS